MVLDIAAMVLAGIILANALIGIVFSFVSLARFICKK